MLRRCARPPPGHALHHRHDALLTRCRPRGLAIGRAVVDRDVEEMPLAVGRANLAGRVEQDGVL